MNKFDCEHVHTIYFAPVPIGKNSHLRSFKMGIFGEDRDGRFADSADIKRGGFYRKGGIYIGLSRMLGRKLFYNREGATIIFGKPEVGKTTKLIIPTLLTYNKGSLVVSDPKGTLTAQTMRRRKKLGDNVIVINPWEDEIKKELGVDYGDTSFNPLSLLLASDNVGQVKDNADYISTLLCPPLANAGDPYWRDTARGILAGCQVLIRFDPEYDCTLTELYKMVHTDLEGWAKIADKMEHFHETHGVNLSSEAKKILAPLENPRQWTGVDGAIKGAVAIYDPDKPLGQHLNKRKIQLSNLYQNLDRTFSRKLIYENKIKNNEFKTNEELKNAREYIKKLIGIEELIRDEITKSLKMPESLDLSILKKEKTTIYIVIPSKRREANKQWLSLVLSMCAETIGTGKPSHPILMVMEEMGNLGWLPIQRFIAELREAGLRAILTLQTVNQLREIYGIEGAKNIIDLCAVRQLLRVDDPEAAREIALNLGTYEHREFDKDGRITVRENRSVMAEHQIMRLPENEQIILASGSTPPIRAKLKPFYQVPEWERLTDANPLRKETKTEIALIIARSVWAKLRFIILTVGVLAAGYFTINEAPRETLPYIATSLALAALLYVRPIPSRVWGKLFVPSKSTGGGGLMSSAVGGLWTGLFVPLIKLSTSILKFLIIGIIILFILEYNEISDTVIATMIVKNIILFFVGWF